MILFALMIIFIFLIFLRPYEKDGFYATGIAIAEYQVLQEITIQIFTTRKS